MYGIVFYSTCSCDLCFNFLTMVGNFSKSLVRQSQTFPSTWSVAGIDFMPSEPFKHQQYSPRIIWNMKQMLLPRYTFNSVILLNIFENRLLARNISTYSPTNCWKWSVTLAKTEISDKRVSKWAAQELSTPSQEHWKYQVSGPKTWTKNVTELATDEALSMAWPLSAEKQPKEAITSQNEESSSYCWCYLIKHICSTHVSVYSRRPVTRVFVWLTHRRLKPLRALALLLSRDRPACITGYERQPFSWFYQVKISHISCTSYLNLLKSQLGVHGQMATLNSALHGWPMVFTFFFHLQ